MGRKSKKAKQRKETPLPEGFPQEERRAEAATIAWMLAGLFTAAMLALHFGMRLLLTLRPELSESMPRLTLIPGLTLFMALIGGSIALMLTPLVLRFRRSPPPESITFTIVTIGAVPLILVVWAIATGS